MYSRNRIREVADVAYVLGLYVSAGVMGAISVMELTGVSRQLGWFRTSLSPVSLLLLSLFVGFLGLTASKLSGISSALQQLTAAYHDRALDFALLMTDDLDPNMKRLFRPHVKKVINNLERAIRKKEIVLRDLTEFRVFYKDTLECFPATTFVATSFPSPEFFWKNNDMEEAIRDFISGRGRKPGVMKRIFFLRDESDLGNEDVVSIMRHQAGIGVEVHYALERDIPSNLRVVFLANRNGKIAWEAEVRPLTTQIESVVAKSDEREVLHYVAIYDKLVASRIARPFRCLA